MKNKKKTILRIFLVIFITAVIFFSIDFYRAQNGKSPIFCIHYSTLKDGGTKEYIGFGYKVIEYHKINGYKNIHVGTFFMQYDDQLGGKNTLEPVNTYESKSDGTNLLSLH